jgi:hypothetical protein
MQNRASHGASRISSRFLTFDARAWRLTCGLLFEGSSPPRLLLLQFRLLRSLCRNALRDDAFLLVPAIVGRSLLFRSIESSIFHLYSIIVPEPSSVGHVRRTAKSRRENANSLTAYKPSFSRLPGPIATCHYSEKTSLSRASALRQFHSKSSCAL